MDVRVKGHRLRRKTGPSKKVAELARQEAEVKIARDQFGFSKNDISLLCEILEPGATISGLSRPVKAWANVVDRLSHVPDLTGK